MKHADTVKINQGLAAADATLAWLVQMVCGLRASVLSALGHGDPVALRAQSRRHLLALAEIYEPAQPGYAEELRVAAGLCEEPSPSASRSTLSRRSTQARAYRID